MIENDIHTKSGITINVDVVSITRYENISCAKKLIFGIFILVYVLARMVNIHKVLLTIQ